MTMTLSSVFLLISNLPKDHGERIAGQLVEARLAACVTLSPVQSVYRWRGDICFDQEITLTAKVSEATLERCVSKVKELHPYDLPEIIVLSVDDAHSYPPYLKWVAEECT